MQVTRLKDEYVIDMKHAELEILVDALYACLSEQYHNTLGDNTVHNASSFKGRFVRHIFDTLGNAAGE